MEVNGPSIYIYILAGGVYHLEKYEFVNGKLKSNIWWKTKNVPNHQPVYHGYANNYPRVTLLSHEENRVSRWPIFTLPTKALEPCRKKKHRVPPQRKKHCWLIFLRWILWLMLCLELVTGIYRYTPLVGSISIYIYIYIHIYIYLFSYWAWEIDKPTCDWPQLVSWLLDPLRYPPVEFYDGFENITLLGHVVQAPILGGCIPITLRCFSSTFVAASPKYLYINNLTVAYPHMK